MSERKSGATPHHTIQEQGTDLGATKAEAEAHEATIAQAVFIFEVVVRTGLSWFCLVGLAGVTTSGGWDTEARNKERKNW